MSLSRSVRRWIVSIVLIVLALIFYRFRWGILGFVNIMPLPETCENIKVLNAYLNAGGNPSAYVGRIPLIMCAAERGSYDIVSRLIDLGVDVDSDRTQLEECDRSFYQAIHSHLQTSVWWAMITFV